MRRNEELRIASAMNEAIYLRDNVAELQRSEVEKGVKRLASYGVFSNRQIHAIINGALSIKVVAELTGKSDRSGGSLNPGSLDLLLSVLYSRAAQDEEYELIAQAVELGTSHHMVSKLTGIHRSTISKRLNRKTDGS